MNVKAYLSRGKIHLFKSSEPPVDLPQLKTVFEGTEEEML